MPVNYLQTSFFLLLLVFTASLAFFVLQPYLGPIIIAATGAIVFYPLYRQLLVLTSGRKNLATFLTVFSVTVIIVMPAILFSLQLWQEATVLYGYLSNPSNHLSDKFLAFTANNLNFGVAASSLNINQIIERILRWVIQQAGPLVTGALQLVLDTFICLIAFYYFLRDGDKITAKLKALSPLKDARDETLLKRGRDVINSVVRGFLLIALIKGVLTSLGFVIFGVPNAVLWGSLTVIAALVPYLGSAIIIAPAVAYLFLANHLIAALGLMIWGILLVGLMDNILGPKLVNRGIKLHPVAILLAVLGGLTFFGPLGYLLGPLVISLFFYLLDIYPVFTRRHSP